jgi:hypothetical protein
MRREEMADMASKGRLKKRKDPKWVFSFFIAKCKGQKYGKKELHWTSGD